MNQSQKTNGETDNKPIAEQQVNNDELSMDVITDFYRKAFEPLDSEHKDGFRVYRVFIGRRSFVQACAYIREHADEMNGFVYDTIYSDGGLRVLASRIAEELYHAQASGDLDALYCWQSQRVILYDDILIYGRALGGLLSAAEDIFADRYAELSDEKVEKELLYDWFLQLVTIKTALKNSQPNLLKIRYRNRIENEGENTCEPKVWRRFSYEIAASIYHSDIPNAAFIPAIRFGKSKDAFKSIKKRFMQLKKEGAFRDYHYTRNMYNNRSLDTYASCVAREGELKALLTLRCTEYYLIPFIFLPALGESSFSKLEQNIVRRLDSILPEAGAALRQKSEEWKGTEKLNVMYVELINMILSGALLRNFIEEIGLWNELENHEDFMKFLHQNTTYQMMMCNYAHDEDIKIILTMLFDPAAPVCFSLDEIPEMIAASLQSDEFIIHESMINTSRKGQDILDIYRVENKLETVVFSYGIESERYAYNLLTGSLSPSYDSIQYFSFPLNNTLSNTLHDIYANRISWLHEKVTVYDVISYLLQMMDAGCFSLTVGENADQYLQCLKTGEQSLNTLTYRYALFLPLLNEIVQRCYRQNNFSSKTLYDEFVMFLDKYPYCDGLDDIDKQILDLYKANKRRLFEMTKMITEAGQNCSDYFFLTEKRMKESYMRMKPAEYYDYCSFLYNEVMY